MLYEGKFGTYNHRLDHHTDNNMVSQMWLWREGEKVNSQEVPNITNALRD